MSYREELYNKYASFFGRSASNEENYKSKQSLAILEYYFRGWLPGRHDAAICDLGCGDGGLLGWLAGRGYGDLTGVDLSPEQLARAPVGAARFLRGDALEHLAGLAARYDLIIARDLVEHLTKDELLRFFAACRAALRPGGRLIVQTPNGDAPLCGSVRYGDLTHELCLTPGLAERLLVHAGFTGFEAREAGPVPKRYEPIALGRYALWRAIHCALLLYNLIELGHRGSGVFTRVFLLSAVRPPGPAS